MIRLSKKALDWALLSVERDGDTDIFPQPFEYELIRKQWPEVRKRLLAIDVTAYKVAAPIRTLTPKRRLGYRVSAQLDPIDHLFYTALVYDIGKSLESVRVKKSKKIVHSYRWKPSKKGRFFDPDYGWDTFRQRSLELAKNNRHSFIVLADIADFYQRLYLHRIERLVSILKPLGAEHHGQALVNLIKQWHNNVSYGIPIGPAASRLIAEVIISDIDELLIEKDVPFTRFNDDYHLFCKSRADAHRSLAYLADILFQVHGLTLQESKTDIISSSDFEKRFSTTETDSELDNLDANFESFLHELDVNEMYEVPQYEDLNEEQKEKLEKLNLDSIVSDLIDQPEPEIKMLRWVLNRMSHLKISGHHKLLLNNLQKLSTVIPEIVKYLRSVSGTIPAADLPSLSGLVLDYIESGSGANLAFHRAWLLSVFRTSIGWNSEKRIVALWEKFDDALTRREVILCLCHLKRESWFRARKDKCAEFSIWEQRAFAVGIKCLPFEEAKAFIKAQKSRFSERDRYVMP